MLTRAWVDGVDCMAKLPSVSANDFQKTGGTNRTYMEAYEILDRSEMTLMVRILGTLVNETNNVFRARLK